MAMREFWMLTTFFLVVLRRALTVAWIRINKLLTNPDWLIRPVTQYRHKVRCVLTRLFCPCRTFSVDDHSIAVVTHLTPDTTNEGR